MIPAEILIGPSFERFAIAHELSFAATTAIGVVFSSLLFGTPLLLIFFPAARHSYRQALIENGACDVCGYLLTGNISGICPECGNAIPARAREHSF